MIYVDLTSITTRIEWGDKNILFLLVLEFLSFISFFPLNNDFGAKTKWINTKVLKISPLIEQNYFRSLINCDLLIIMQGGYQNWFASKFTLSVNKSTSIQILEKVYIFIPIPQNNLRRILQFILNNKTSACGDDYLVRRFFVDKDYLDLIIKTKKILYLEFCKGFYRFAAYSIWKLIKWKGFPELILTNFGSLNPTLNKC